MGRRKSYEITQVLQIMGQIFVAHGYESTSLDDLEKGTGLLRGSLYREFGSKRNMFQLSLEQYLDNEVYSDIALDLLIIALHELTPRDYQLRNFLSHWYLRYSKDEQSISELLGNRLLDQSQILIRRDE